MRALAPSLGFSLTSAFAIVNPVVYAANIPFFSYASSSTPKVATATPQAQTPLVPQPVVPVYPPANYASLTPSSPNTGLYLALGGAALAVLALTLRKKK